MQRREGVPGQAPPPDRGASRRSPFDLLEQLGYYDLTGAVSTIRCPALPCRGIGRPARFWPGNLQVRVLAGQQEIGPRPLLGLPHVVEVRDLYDVNPGGNLVRKAQLEGDGERGLDLSDPQRFVRALGRRPLDEADEVPDSVLIVEVAHLAESTDPGAQRVRAGGTTRT